MFRGACAQVRAGKCKKTGIFSALFAIHFLCSQALGVDVAVKIINGTICEIVPADLWSQIAKQLRTCQSEFIMPLLDDYADENGVYLVLERYVIDSTRELVY
jgi:hypothetical protein